MKKSMNLYRVSTTFLGADSASQFYFDTEGKANKFLSNCDNGEIDKVRVTNDYLNYSDECTFADLVFGMISSATEDVI